MSTPPGTPPAKPPVTVVPRTPAAAKPAEAPPAPINFALRKIKVSGTIIEVDTAKELRIVDLSDDMSMVASQMAWWASVRAEALKEQAKLDAQYRRWRAQKTLSLDPKLAEYMKKAHIESDSEFMAHKNKLADNIDAVDLATGMFEAFSKKGNILQSRGAMKRDEMSKQGMTTRKGGAEAPDDAEPESSPRPPSRSAPAPSGAVARKTPAATPRVAIGTHKDKLKD